MLPRVRTMKGAQRLFSSLVCVGLCSLTTMISAEINVTNAGKATIDATATTFNGELRFTDFNIDYLDTGDGALDFDEIVGFSGVDMILAPFSFYSDIAYVPAISAPAANASGTLNPVLPCLTCWEFTPSNAAGPSDGWDQGYWNYSVTTFGSSAQAFDVINLTGTPLTPSASDLTFGPEIELTLVNTVLEVVNGSAMTAGSLLADDAGILDISGPGSQVGLIADRTRMVLHGPYSSLNVVGAGVLNATAGCASGQCDLVFGNLTGDVVTVNVDGIGSQLSTSNAIVAGFGDTDDTDFGIFGADSDVFINVSNGGVINSAEARLGVGLIGSAIQPGQLITVDVQINGAGSAWNTAGTLDVGVGANADATLSVLDAAGINAGAMNVGVGTGTGRVHVSGASAVNVNGLLVMGTPIDFTGTVSGNAYGELDIQSGSTVQAVDIILGENGALFSDASATLIADSLRIDRGGFFDFSGSLQVVSTVVDNSFIVTSESFEPGMVAQTSTIAATNGSFLGFFGGATFGGVNGDVDVTVDGAGSQLNVSGLNTALRIGVYGGTGSLHIGSLATGLLDGSDETGAASSMEFSVGVGGNGYFEVVSGGQFTMDDFFASTSGNALLVGASGPTGPGSGDVLVDGAGSQLALRNPGANLQVGVSGTSITGTAAASGTVTVSNGGSLIIDSPTAGAAIFVGRGGGAQGVLSVTSGGSVTVLGSTLVVGSDDGATTGGGSGRVDIDAGSISFGGVQTPGASTALIGFGAGSGEMNVVNGGLFDVDGSLIIASANPASGANSATGRVFVGLGSSVIANDTTIGANGELAGTGDIFGLVSVTPGGALNLASTIFDDVQNNGGLVSPAGDPGTGVLTVVGDYTQTAGTLRLNVAGVNPGEFDQLNVLGDIDLLGGSVDLDLQNSLMPTDAEGIPVLRSEGALNIDPGVQYNVGAGLPAFELSPVQVFEIDPQTGGQIAVQLGQLSLLEQDLATLAGPLGLTPNEVSLVNSFQQSCATTADEAALNDDQIDFLNICASVRNAGNSAEQVQQSLKAMDTEEATQLTNSLLLFTIPQHGNLSQRINAIRNGSNPFDLSGFNVVVDDHVIAGADLDRFIKRLVGGAAGASDEFSKWGVFGSGNINFGDRDATKHGDGFDFETMSMTLGVDYRAQDNLVLGGSMSYSKVNADFNEGGGMDLTSWSASVFGTYFIEDKYYLDVLATFGRNDLETSRHVVFDTVMGPVNRRADSDTDGGQYSLSVGTGYDFTQEAWVYGPHAGLNFTELDVDRYAEQGAQGLDLTIDRQVARSFTANAGFHASYTLTPAWGVLIPYVRADWVYEFETDAQVTDVNFSINQFVNDPDDPTIPMRVTTDRRDSNYFVFSAGASAQFVQGVSGFVNYRGVVGMQDISLSDVTFGLRFERSW